MILKVDVLSRCMDGNMISLMFHSWDDQPHSLKNREWVMYIIGFSYFGPKFRSFQLMHRNF